MNKQFALPAALATALLGLSVSGTALALPEVEVGSRLLAGSNAAAQAQSIEPTDPALAEEDDSASTADEAQSTSN
jgi:hypothetical protein